jgi:hypothetical protein
MRFVELETLHAETAEVIGWVADDDVSIVANGKVVAIMTRPHVRAEPKQRTAEEHAAFIREREERLSSIKLLGEWDSTQAISEDRDRF